MGEFVPALVVVLIGTSAAWLHAVRSPRSEFWLLMTSFAAHIFSASVQVWIGLYIYKGGDIFGYAEWANLVASALRLDFSQFAPEVIKLFFHLPALIPAIVPGQGTSTGSMAAIAGVLVFVTGGDVYTLCYTVAIFAYFGQVALYRAFREAFGDENRRRLLVSVLLIPSSVFWTSVVVKEPMAVMGQGFLILGLERAILKKVELKSLLMMAFGVMIIGLLKAYILAATVIALAASIYLRKGRRLTSSAWPVRLVLAAGIGALCFVALARLEPKYSPENIGEQAAYYQQLGQDVQAGSAYSIGDANATSAVGQLAFAPLALFTAVFRPLIFEAKNPLILANALETSVLIFFTIRALARRGIRETWRVITANPMLMFCLVFVVTFGTGVGLTSMNLGSLSRYRMPLVPFMWAMVLLLDAKKKVPVQTPAAARIAARQAWLQAARRAETDPPTA